MVDDFKTTFTLIGQAKSGKDEALNLLLSRYMERVLRIVRLRMGPQLRQRTESMDVVQEVMIRAIKGFENFELKDEGAFLHWISQLVNNQIRDMADYQFAQKRSPHKEVSKKNSEERSVIGSLPADTVRPSIQLQLKQEVLELETALDQLSDQQREVIIMRQYEGVSFKDIGKTIDCSEDAARMQFARAMDKLTDIMTKNSE